MPLFAVVAVALGVLAPTACAQTTTATCSYAEWTFNSKNENACSVWAQLQDICSPGARVGSVSSSTAPYGAPGQTSTIAADPCNCNIVAYNLMAGCSWCQPGIYSSDWVLYGQWASECSDFNPTGLNTDIESSVRSEGIIIPTWARLDISGNTWSSGRAENWAEDSASSTPTPSDTSVPSAGSSGVASATGSRNFTSGQSRPTITSPMSGDDDDWDDRDSGLSTATQTAIGVVVGVFIGLPLLCSLIAIGVYCARQKSRKQFYGPLAAYYRAGGPPPPGLPTAASGVAPGMTYAPQPGYEQGSTVPQYTAAPAATNFTGAAPTGMPQSPSQATSSPTHGSPVLGYAISPSQSFPSQPSQGFPSQPTQTLSTPQPSQSFPVPQTVGTPPPAQYADYAASPPYQGSPPQGPPPGAYAGPPAGPAGVPLV